jgi:outer membrane protein
MRLKFLTLVKATILGLALGAGTGAVLPTADAHAEQLSVVFVDVDKVVKECDEGKNADQVLKAEQAKRQEEIGTREAEIKKLQDDLEKQAKAFSAAAIEKKAAQYQQAVIDYQNLVIKFNKDLEEKDRQLFDPIEKRVKQMLRDVALREGYDMILNKRSVPYGRKDLDLTDRVTQEYNKTYPAKVSAPPPPKKGAPPAKPASSGPAPAPKMK